MNTFYFRRTSNPNLYLQGVGTISDPLLIAYGSTGDQDKEDIITAVTNIHAGMGLPAPQFTILNNYTILSNGTLSISIGYE